MVAAAVLPLLGWLTFAWWYYGAFASNPWLADHVAGASWGARASAGAAFLRETGRLDLLLIGIIALGALAGLAAGGMSALLALGALLQTAVVVSAGGHAMAGRDLTVPFLIGVMLLGARLALGRPRTASLATAAVVGLALVSGPSTLTSGADYGRNYRPTARAHDARAEFYQATGLLLENRGRRAPVHPEVMRAIRMARSGVTAAVSPTPGMFAAAAPNLYVIDPLGRTDPLLARLPPAVGVRTSWGAVRRLPAGYLDSVAGEPAIAGDDALAGLERRVEAATRWPLARPGRLASLLALPADTRRLVSASSYGPQRLSLDDLSGPAPRMLREGGAVVAFGGARRSRTCASSSCPVRLSGPPARGRRRRGVTRLTAADLERRAGSRPATLARPGVRGDGPPHRVRPRHRAVRTGADQP